MVTRCKLGGPAVTSIELRPALADQIKSEADRRQTDLEVLVNEWLEAQLWQERQKAIPAEAERFRARHAELLVQYRGRYVAMRAGSVIDDDADLVALHNRVRAKYGEEPILIAPVEDNPIQTFRVLGARQAVRRG